MFWGIILLLTIFSTINCKSKPYPDQELIYSSINEAIQADSIFMPIVCGKFDIPDIPIEIRKEFFEDDNNFVDLQIAQSKKLKVGQNKVFYCGWCRKGRMRTTIDTTCSTGIIYRISYPVFSRDLQTVAIGITQDCHCMLGGWGFNAVYRKKNGKWIKVKTYYSWIS
jgi:hypothetical protein